MKKNIAIVALVFASLALPGEVKEINGVRYECTDDGICRMVTDGEAPVSSMPFSSADVEPSRIAQGYMGPEEFLAFLRGEPSPDAVEGSGSKSLWLVLWMAFIGGILMNLTPCVLPMVPVNLMIIGKSASRGALYGLGIAIAYGAMGVLAAVGSMAFGEIQANPWFNASVAIVFFALGLSMFGAFFIDFSKKRGVFAGKKGKMLPGVFAFLMGAVSAVLAGACVAPVLIAVLLLTARMYAEGQVFALGLPFVLGLGMALPWPFAGAGMRILPKPGAWMGKVSKAFGVFVMMLAAYYAFLAYRGFSPSVSAGSILPSQLPEALEDSPKPVFVDCWASWCKNCDAMEKTTLANPSVAEALKDFTVIRVQAEDIRELASLPGLESVKGLPAFMVYE